MIVEPPSANGLAQNQHLRRISRISNVGHHAIERGERVSDYTAFVMFPRTHTIPPWRSTNIVDERRADPCQMASCLSSGSRLNIDVVSGFGSPMSIRYPNSSPANPSRRLTGCFLLVPWTG